jgi:PKD repeat protein
MSISSVTVTLPTAGTNVSPGANLHVQYTAVSSLGEITGWQIYLGSTQLYNLSKTATSGVLPQSIDIQLPIPSNAALGNAQTLTLKAFDSSGASGQATRSINIVQTSTGVVTVTRTSPAAGASVDSDGTFHVTASATTTATTITGWQVWLDSVLLYDPNSGMSGAIDQILTIPIGTAIGNHTLAIKAWDNTGSMGQQQSTLVVSLAPLPSAPGTPLGSKLVADLTAHNVSGAPNYNQTNFPANFTGITNHDGNTLATNAALNDDSENPSALMVISKESVRNLMPTGWTGRIGMHCQFWWGRSNHPAIGFNDRDPATCDAIIQDIKDRGYDVIIPDWYSPTKTSVLNDSDVDNIAASCVKSNLNFMVMIDQQYFSNNGYTASTYQAGIIAAIQHLMDRYASHPNYEHYTYNGVSRPLILLWDVARVGGANINWATVRSQVSSHGNPLIIQYQASGFTVIESDGALSWVDTNADKAGSPASGSSYLTNSFLPACSAHQDKICLSSVWCGFNGTLTKSTTWSLGKWLDKRNGQTWLDVWKTNSDYVAGGKRLDYVCTVTLDDYQEGSAVQGGIRTDITINLALSGNLLNFSVTGNENSVRRYNLWGSTDGITAQLLDTKIPTDAKQFDLTALPGIVSSGLYTLYLEAQGMPSLECHLAPQTPQRQFTLNIVPPTAALSADSLSGIVPLTVNFNASQSHPAAQPIVDYRFDFGDSTAIQEGISQTASHTYTSAGVYTVTLTVTASDGGIGTATIQISVSEVPPPPPTSAPQTVAIAGLAVTQPKGVQTVYEIPLKARAQSLDIKLNGVQYTLVIRWNGKSWVMDIKSSKGVMILSGIPLITGADLLAQYKYLKLGGQLVVQTDGGVTSVPTFANLGSKSHLFFIVTTAS